MSEQPKIKKMIKFTNQFVSISRFLLFTLFLFSCYTQVWAQDSTKVKKWHFLAEPYLMFPYMDGETGIDNALILPVEANPSDIFSHLQMAAMLYFEARTDKWAITTDLVYMNLKQDVTSGKLISSGKLNVKQTIWEVAGFYSIFSFWEVGVGGRLNYLQTEHEVHINTLPIGNTKTETGNHNETWFDPVIKTRFLADVKDKWLFQLIGDVGGFGVGSKLTWQVQGYAGYRFCKLFQLSAGYRYLSTDYISGEEPKEFTFNMSEFGPVIRFGFNF